MKKLKFNYLLMLVVMGSFIIVSCEKEDEFSEYDVEKSNISAAYYAEKHNDSLLICEGGDPIDSNMNFSDTTFIECAPFPSCNDSSVWSYNLQNSETVLCMGEEQKTWLDEETGTIAKNCGSLKMHDYTGDVDIYSYSINSADGTIIWSQEGEKIIVWSVLADQPNEQVLQTKILDNRGDCKHESKIVLTLTR